MEGLITIVVSLISFFLILPFPENNKRFSGEERAVILARTAADKATYEEERGPWWRWVLAAATDRKVWLA